MRMKTEEMKMMTTTIKKRMQLLRSKMIPMIMEETDWEEVMVEKKMKITLMKKKCLM
jgi:hypothetical protein